MTDNRTGGVTNYSYDAASNVATVAYPNGVQTLFHYDTLNRVMGATTQQAGYIYQRDAAGNLTSVMDANGRTVNWSYDGIYRLTNETISLDPAKHNGSVGYGLDPVGNRLSETSTLAGVSSGSFGYNADDELATETYDQNGNVLTSGGKSFSYDAENHLVAMNGGAVQMVYDAFGNRVAKSANGVTTSYLVEDDVNPTGYPQVMDELTNGVVTRTYTYGVQRIDGEQVVNSTWTASYYGYDGMGTVRQLTNSTGAITDTYDYDAFGNLVNSTGTTPNIYLYRGEQWDADLGLYYLRARYYNPVTGRFMSRDPFSGTRLLPFTYHKYLYAGANPIRYADPRGREALEEDAVRETISSSEKVTRFFGAIGCGTSLGFYAGAAIMDVNAFKEGVTEYWPIPASVAVGCVATFLPNLLEGSGSIAVDIVGAIGCTAGIRQTVDDYNKFLADFATSGTDNYSADLSAFQTDLISSVWGCGTAGAASIIDIGGYYE